jgi:hypothetical protein
MGINMKKKKILKPIKLTWLKQPTEKTSKQEIEVIKANLSKILYEFNKSYFYQTSDIEEKKENEK